MQITPGAEQSVLQLAAALAAGGLCFGTYVAAGMLPASTLYGSALYAPPRPREIALTFDDGPNPEHTPRLLEILARHGLHASFFLIGSYAAAQRPLVREMRAAGHLIGNHSWTHPNLAFCSPASTRQELARTSQELEDTLGEATRFFRPPFGARSPWTIPIARQLGLRTVLWNALTTDWSAQSPEPILRAHNRSIARHLAAGRATNLVLHDGGQGSMTEDRSHSVTAAEAIIRAHPKASFVTLDAWA